MKKIILLLAALGVCQAQAQFFNQTWNSGFGNSGNVPDGNLSGWSDTRTVSGYSAQGPLSLSVTLNSAAPIAGTYSETNILCNGGSTGAITVSASGGTSPYQYALNSASFGSSGSFSGLTAGTYTVHIKDASGCTKDRRQLPALDSQG